MIKNLFRKGEGGSDEPAVPQGAGQKATILVVDDSPTEVHVFKKILEKQGYTILVAKDGQEGIDLAKRSHPDLILMDVVMPVLNGFQATRQLKNSAETADIPVIMVTTKGEPVQVEEAFLAGCSDYVTKPLNKLELLEKVSKYMP